MRQIVSAVLLVACSHPAPPESQRPDQPLKNTVVVAIDAAPAGLAITSVEPSHGDIEGGTYVVIKGSHFMSDGPRNVKVYFGNRQGTVVRFQSDHELIVQAPGGKPGEGPVDVLVIFDPGGVQKLPGAFTFVDKAVP